MPSAVQQPPVDARWADAVACALPDLVSWVRRAAADSRVPDSDVDDIVQEAVLVALMRPRPVGAAAWMIGIARNLLRARMRARPPSVLPDETIASTPGPLERAERLDDVRAVADALAHLSPGRRALWLSRHVDGHPWERLADRFGLTQATAEYQVRAATAHVRRRLRTRRVARVTQLEHGARRART